MMLVKETIQAWGHPNITGSHRTTFEVTKAKTVSLAGDCVIAVAASKGARGLSEAFKRIAQNARTQITVLFEAGELQDWVVGRGHPRLTFTHPEDLVARTSSYTCPRTLMIHADKAAQDLSRDLIRYLQNPCQQIVLTLIAKLSY
jgi:hypothetical protein